MILRRFVVNSFFNDVKCKRVNKTDESRLFQGSVLLCPGLNTILTLIRFVKYLFAIDKSYIDISDTNHLIKFEIL